MIEIILSEIARNILYWVKENSVILSAGVFLFLTIPLAVYKILKIKGKGIQQAQELSEALADGKDGLHFKYEMEPVINISTEKLKSKKRKIFILKQEDLIQEKF